MAKQKNPGEAKLKACHFYSNGHVMEPRKSSIIEGYLEVLNELRSEGRTVTPDRMTKAALGTGTHLVKMVNPKIDSKKTGTVLVVRSHPSGGVGDLYPSVNSADIPYAKLLHRPMDVTGYGVRSLADHVLNPNGISDVFLEAFSEVFGRECLEAARQALISGPEPVTSLPGKNFPIVFLPSSKGDVQVTPLSPASLINEVAELEAEKRDLYFKALKSRSEGSNPEDVVDPIKIPRRGNWSRQHLSGKPQNISGKIRARRLRLMAQIPEGPNQYEAGIWSLMNGGNFPKIGDPQLKEYVLDYTAKIKKVGSYENPDIRRGLDYSAKRIIVLGYDFISDVLLSLSELQATEKTLPVKSPEIPSVRDLVFKSAWWGDQKEVVRKSLSGEHFAKILKEAAQ